MRSINLSDNNTLLNIYLSEIRDKQVQQDPLRFRKNIERIGQLMAYEMSKEFTYKPVSVVTPLAVAEVSVPEDKIVIATILRAGLPFHQGFLSSLDHAENAFVSAYRQYTSQTEFEIHTEYIASPSLEGKTLIICDPMLATGSSMEVAYKALLSKGKPKKVYLASILATPQAIAYLDNTLPEDVTLYTAAIDPVLNEHKYIVPGLGDAGDLAFGEKL